MQKLLGFHRGVATILGLLVIALVLLIVVDAGGRFLFNRPLRGGIEISRVVLAWMLYMSLAYGLVRRTHVRVEVFLIKYPRRLRLVAEVLIALLSIGFFGLMAYGGWFQFWNSFTRGETMAAPIWIPFWLAKLAVPVGTLIFVLQFLIDLVSSLRDLVSSFKTEGRLERPAVAAGGKEE